jgi:hypothetical protein
MPIDPTRLSEIQPGSPDPIKVAGGRAAAPGKTRPPGDVVEISDEARALAEAADADRAQLTELRTREIRERLASGFYTRAEVVRQIAERIVDSGDL